MRENALARIDEHDGQFRSGRTGHHVARILFVAGRIGDDELAGWRNGDSHVDGDALFTFGTGFVGRRDRSRSQQALRPADALVTDSN